MHIPNTSRTLYIVRIIQLLFAVGFLIIICWSGTHRGWWDNINGPLAVGVISFLFTLALSIFSIVAFHRNSSPFSGGSKVRMAIGVSIEVVLFLLYIASATLMLRPKDGCDFDKSEKSLPVNGIVACENHGGKWLSTDQPLTEWDIAIAFSFIQIVSYLASAFLVWRESRSSKVGGGASYA